MADNSMRGSSDTMMITEADLNLAPRHTYQEQRRVGFKPRKDCRPWPFSVPVDWTADPFGDKNWVFMLQSWRMLDPILTRYFETRESRYLRESMEIALDWWAAAQTKEFLKKWNDMSTGLRALRIAFLHQHRDACDLSQAECSAFTEMLDVHARMLMGKNFISSTNHGIAQVFGLKALTDVGHDRPSLRGAYPHAAAALDRILEAQFSDEGVQKEHSPSYHFFVLNSFSGFNVDRHFPKAAPTLARASAVAPWLVFPDRRVAPIGDSNTTSRPLKGPDVIADYTRSGYAIARDPQGQWMIFATGMCHSPMHKHTDELSFLLYDGGRHIFVDTGKYGYINDEWRAYAYSAAAHNTISVLEREIGKRDVEFVGSCLSRIYQERDRYIIEGEVMRPELFKQNRKIVYRPGRSLTIRDKLLADRHWTYVSSLHLEPDLLPKAVANGFTVELGDGRTMRGEVDAEVKIARGETNPIRGWVTEDYLRMTPTSTIMAIAPGRNRSVTWRIKIEG